MQSLNRTYRVCFFLFLVFSSLLNFYFIKEEDTIGIIITKITTIVFIGFYFFDVLRKNKFLFIALLLFLASTLFFTNKTDSIIGVILVIFYRICLVKSILPTKVDWKTFTKIFAIFLFIFSILLALAYSKVLFYYLAIIATLALAFLASLAFTNLIAQNSKKNILVFVGVFLFIVCDGVFGAQKIGVVDYLNIIIGTALYIISFFLICLSEEIEAKNQRN